MSAAPRPLDGQVAVVTGGGRGIGQAVARALAADGAAVAVVARTPAQVDETVKLIADEGGVATAVVADVTDAPAVDAAIRRVEHELGPIDLLVNGAGRSQAVGPVWETDRETWWADVEVNLLGCFLWCHATLPAMVARGRGRIVNVVSNSVLLPHPYNSAYAASKAALAHFTGSLAAEIAPHGLSAFALSPGSVRTQLSQGVTASPVGQRWLSGLSASLGPRWTTPDHAARAVAFIATGAADGLSGRFIHAVDDDIPALAARAADVVETDTHRLVLRRLSDANPARGV